MIAKIKQVFSNRLGSVGLPILALCWVSFFWGTTWVAYKEGVKYVPALQLVTIQQFIAGVLYVVYFILKKEPWPKGKQWQTVFVLSILNFACSNGLSTWGIKYVGSGLSAIICTVFPIWIIIICLFRGERIAKLAVVGLLICFTGICIIFLNHLTDFLNPEFQFGIFLLLASTITWSFGILYIMEKAASFNPYFSLGLQMIISSVILFSITEAAGINISLNKIPVSSWLSIAYLVIISSVLTFIAFVYTLQHLPKEISTSYIYINPIVALLLGFILFDETLTLTIIMGALVTLIGLYLVNVSIRKIKK